jgi:hypothetical protein
MPRNEYAAFLDRSAGATLYDALPQFRPYPFRYGVRAMRAFGELERAGTYKRVLHVFPTHAERSFLPGESKEDQASMPAGSFVLGFTGVSDQAAGYRVSIWDNEDRPLLGGSVLGANIAGAQGTPAFVPGLIFGFPRPAQIIVRLTNLATVAAEIQFAMRTAERKG